LLVFILGAYTYKLYLLSKYDDRILVQPNVITTKKLVYLTTIITLLLASRCIYDILVLSDSNTRTEIETDKDLPYIAFFLYILWETLPTNLILFVFRRIPRTSVVRFPRLFGCNRNIQEEEEDHPITHAPVNYTPTPIKDNFFNNPRRYESDEEEESKPLKKGGKNEYVSPY